MEINGYENYTITRDGKVFNNTTKKELKHFYQPKDGIPFVSLGKNGKWKNFSVGRLVYKHYVGPLEEYEIIGRIDKDKTNNNPENLRVCMDNSKLLKYNNDPKNVKIDFKQAHEKIYLKNSLKINN